MLAERWCDSALLPEHGRVVAEGVPPDVVAAYVRSTAAEDAIAG